MDDDERIVRFAGREIDAEHLAHGYADHRARARGRPCASPTPSRTGAAGLRQAQRGKERSMVYAVGDDLEQAAEDLVRAWSVSRRIRLAIETELPSREAEPAARVPQPDADVVAALPHACLRAERDALVAAVPPDWREQTGRNLDALGALGRQREDLARCTGRYAETAVGAAARELAEVRRWRERAEALAHSPSSSRRQRRSFSKEAEAWLDREAELQRPWQRLSSPELARLDRKEASPREADTSLRERVRNRREWLLAQHPEIAPRLACLDREIETLERASPIPRVPRSSLLVDPNRG
jgi:hypothetical protein